MQEFGGWELIFSNDDDVDEPPYYHIYNNRYDYGGFLFDDGRSAGRLLLEEGVLMALFFGIIIIYI